MSKQTVAILKFSNLFVFYFILLSLFLRKRAKFGPGHRNVCLYRSESEKENLWKYKFVSSVKFKSSRILLVVCGGTKQRVRENMGVRRKKTIFVRRLIGECGDEKKGLGV